jgi:TRAP-type uncharacterized transport system fused permease subunit
MSFATATTGVLVLSVTCIGWLFLPLTLPERALSGISALFLMFSGWRTDLIGLALLVLLSASAYWRNTRRRDTGAAALASERDDRPAASIPGAQTND